MGTQPEVGDTGETERRDKGQDMVMGMDRDSGKEVDVVEEVKDSLMAARGGSLRKIFQVGPHSLMPAMGSTS